MSFNAAIFTKKLIRDAVLLCLLKTLLDGSGFCSHSLWGNLCILALRLHLNIAAFDGLNTQAAVIQLISGAAG
jgi:hypothetical protein